MRKLQSRESISEAVEAAIELHELATVDGTSKQDALVAAQQCGAIIEVIKDWCESEEEFVALFPKAALAKLFGEVAA